jgi:predicted transcriptional regulator
VGRKRKSITQRKLAVLSARVDYAVYKKIESIAEREDRTKTQIVRAALREYMERQKR